MADITSPGARSRRLSWLDNFTAIGSCIGLPLGAYIRNNYGSAGGATILVAILYVIFMVQESVVKDNKEDDNDLVQLKVDKGCLNSCF